MSDSNTKGANMDYDFYGFNFRESNIATFATKSEARAAIKQSCGGFRPAVSRGCTRFHYFWIVVDSRPSFGNLRMVGILQKNGSFITTAHPGFRVGDQRVSA